MHMGMVTGGPSASSVQACSLAFTRSTNAASSSGSNASAMSMRTCADLISGYNPAASLGYYQTEAEADAARVRHVEEAGDR